jgi:hypothetical protein
VAYEIECISPFSLAVDVFFGMVDFPLMEAGSPRKAISETNMLYSTLD